MYHYTECGLRNVWLANGYRKDASPKYGELVSIEHVEGLHTLIADQLIEKSHLTGLEFRFLRKELGLSQAKLAQAWGYDEQSIALWEKRGRVPKIADRFIRAYYNEVRHGNANITALIERLNDQDLAEEERRLTFEETEAGWRLAA